MIAAVPDILLALVQLGSTDALLVGLGCLIANVVIANVVMGNIVEPKFIGKGVGLPTLVVFSSLVFWGWNHALIHNGWQSFWDQIFPPSFNNDMPVICYVDVNFKLR